MQTLQNRWYNSLTEQLGLNRATFQIGIPWSPIAPSDIALWEYQNVIPPYSLTFDRTMGADSFFTQYSAVAAQMSFPADELQHEIGAQHHSDWLAFLSRQIPRPPENQLPALFSQWAMVYAPEIAQIGSSILSRKILIMASEQAILPYLGSGAHPPDFLGSYQQLLHVLASASNCSMFFNSDQTGIAVSDTWAKGHTAGPRGLWTGSSADSQLGGKFGHSRVTVSVKFKLALVAVNPGSWYNSALVQLAYSNRKSPPWPLNPNPTWADLFGPEGSMLRMFASLIAVDGMQATVTSNAGYSTTEQEIIRNNAGKGLWPLYASDSAVVCNEVSFQHQGTMSVTTTSEPQNPVFIGANILSTPQYLGHAGGA